MDQDQEIKEEHFHPFQLSVENKLILAVFFQIVFVLCLILFTVQATIGLPEIKLPSRKNNTENQNPDSDSFQELPADDNNSNNNLSQVEPVLEPSPTITVFSSPTVAFTATSESRVESKECSDNPEEPRLTIGGKGIVTDDNTDLLVRVRVDPGRNFDTLFQIGPANGEFIIVDGPQCVENEWWYQIRTRSNDLGWLIEASSEYGYHVAPVPSITNIHFCDRPCNEANAQTLTSFEEGVTKINTGWDYSGMLPGTPYTRIWSNQGEEWVRYNCIWQGDLFGSWEVPLREPDKLRSGTWEITILIDGKVAAKGEIVVNGNITYWFPAGNLPCSDFDS